MSKIFYFLILALINGCHKNSECNTDTFYENPYSLTENEKIELRECLKENEKNLSNIETVLFINCLLKDYEDNILYLENSFPAEIEKFRVYQLGVNYYKSGNRNKSIHLLKEAKDLYGKSINLKFNENEVTDLFFLLSALQVIEENDYSNFFTSLIPIDQKAKFSSYIQELKSPKFSQNNLQHNCP